MATVSEPPAAPSAEPRRRRFRPVHGLLLVPLFIVAVWATDSALEGGFRAGAYELVRPDGGGTVRIDVSALAAEQVRFFRFLNRGNQEVRFFVGRDENGAVQVAYDANEICYKRKRGFKAEDGWLVCRVCDKPFRLTSVNEGGGGCRPIPLTHRLEGATLVLAEADILNGWRYFR
jgi:uncharacterized membrane protein